MKRKGRSAAFMRSINPYLRHKKTKNKKVVSMAKKKGGGSKSKPIMLGHMRLSLKNDLLLIGGAAGAGAIGGVANKLSGGRLTGNVAQLAGGLALAFLGGTTGGKIAKGVFLKTGSDFVEDNIVPKVMGAVMPTATAPTATSNTNPSYIYG